MRVKRNISSNIYISVTNIYIYIYYIITPVYAYARARENCDNSITQQINVYILHTLMYVCYHKAMDTSNTRVVAIRLPTSDICKLAAAARADGRTLAGYLRQCVLKPHLDTIPNKEELNAR